MYLEDLSRTVRQAIEADKIGTLVSARLHWQLSDPQADLVAAAATLLELIEPQFEMTKSRLLARNAPADHQLTVLLETDRGRTVFVTVGRGSVHQATLHLLLIGNHGLIRLDGSELDDSPAPTAAAVDAKRFAQIAQSIAELSPVSPIGSS